MKPITEHKFAYVDALRGFAILGVLLAHANQYGTSLGSATLDGIALQGSRGVQLFYLASAFTLFLSFQKRQTLEAAPVQNFFIRRFFRIAPMYYIGIVYYLIQDGFGARFWLGDQPTITPANIVSNITFTHGFYPYWITSLVPGGWSIAIEMMFYLMLPILVKYIKNLNQAMLFFIGSLFFRLLLHVFFMRFSAISDTRLWEDYLFLYLPSQLPVFALGTVLYFLVFDAQKESIFSSKIGLSLCVILISNQLFPGKYALLPNHLIYAIAFLFFAFALSQKQYPIFVNKLTCFMGKISFSIYLVHIAVLHWLAHFQLVDFAANPILNFGIRFVLLLAITVLIAFVTYRFIELPFQALGKKIIDRIEQRKLKSAT
ncbi:MAG: acyltransferase family protein [Bacteroidia bacterium]